MGAPAKATGATSRRAASPPKGHTSRTSRRTLPRSGGPPRYSNKSVKPVLLRAAVDAASRRGYQALRISDITDPANVTRQAFYAHFRDKRHCLCEALDPRLAAIERMAVTDASPETIDAGLGPDWSLRILATVDELLGEHFGSAEGTKGRLIEALAEELRTTHSLAGVRIGSLVKRAHVPQGDFYKVFSGKRECFAALYEQRLQGLIEEAKQAAAPTSVMPGRSRLLSAFAAGLAADRDRARLVVIGEGELPAPAEPSTLGVRRGVLVVALDQAIAEIGEPVDRFLVGSLVEVIRSAAVAGGFSGLGDRLVHLSESFSSSARSAESLALAA